MFRPSLGLFESSWRFWEPKCWNAQFLPLTWPWPDTWPFKKSFKSALEPSRRDLSNAASPVSLRSLVWELAWGGRYTPPPPGQWRSAETPVKRGLTLISPFRARAALKITIYRFWLRCALSEIPRGSVFNPFVIRVRFRTPAVRWFKSLLTMQQRIQAAQVETPQPRWRHLSSESGSSVTSCFGCGLPAVLVRRLALLPTARVIPRWTV